MRPRPGAPDPNESTNFSLWALSDSHSPDTLRACAWSNRNPYLFHGVYSDGIDGSVCPEAPCTLLGTAGTSDRRKGIPTGWLLKQEFDFDRGWKSLMKPSQIAGRAGPSLVKTLVSALLVLLALAFAPGWVPASHAQTNISGVWVIKTTAPDGNVRSLYFEFKQVGEAVTGQMMFGPGRGRPISDGNFKDGKLHFVMTFGRAPQSRQIPYDGTLKDGKLYLTLPGFRGQPPRTAVAERASAEDLKALQPPPRLPLPALHHVRYNGLAKTPPMGWNSWNKFAGQVNDQDVRGMAKAMVTSGMKAAGYTYVNIDDTWEGPRDAKGEITTNNKFPDMKALADYVHSLGLKFGIYSSPGPTTCAGYTGTYGHVQQDADTYAKWGVDYLKYDWCSETEIYPVGGHGYPTVDEMRGVYQEMGDALLKTGRPIVFSLCEYGWDDVWNWGATVGGNLWRITGDIGDNWNSMIRNGLGGVNLSKYTRPGHWNDPDMLEIGNGHMTDEEYRTHMSLWSMLAAPLIAGNDLRSMTPDIKAILTNREVIAIDQDPAGKPVDRLTDPQSTQLVLTRPLADGSHAVGLFNLADQPQSITVNWSAAGISGKKLRARDLWEHTNVRVSLPAYTATVPAHGVVLLRVK